MKENNKKKELELGISLKTQWIIGIIFVSLMTLLVHRCNIQDDNEINTYYNTVNGTIIAIYRANWQSRTMYEYKVNGEKFRASDSTPNALRGCIVDKECVGTTWKVEYSTKNPNKSRLADTK